MSIASSTLSKLNSDSSKIEQIQRTLIAWMDTREEQLQTLLGRPVLPTDDLSTFQELIDTYTAALTSRPAFTPTNPLVDTEDMELREHLVNMKII